MTRKICVIGAGRWGKNHIKTLAELGSLAGIVDTREDTLKWFQEKYPKIQTFTNVTDALAHDFDGFTVATPAEAHYELAKLLINAGKPVLVEKPITLHAAQAQEIADLARSRGVPVMVGHVMLFHPAIRKMRELIASGKIGKLQYLYSNRVNLGTIRTEENILWSFAPHDISIFQYFTGALPTEVLARGGAYVQPHIHDSTMTVLTYPNNVVGHIFVSWLHPFKEHRLVVIGSKGMLSYDDSSAEKNLFFYEKGVNLVRGEPVSHDGPTEIVPYEKGMPLTEELKHFIECIGTRKVEYADADSAVQVLEVLERATASLLGTASSTNSSAINSTNTITPTAENKGFYAHPSSFVDQPVKIGEGTKIWHYSHVQSESEIGMNCSIGQNVNIGNRVKIGNHVKIQNNVSVYEGVELEDYVFCGPSMVFTNILQPRSKYPQRGSAFYKKTLVREGASIGANATIVCGNTIGRHAFIAAGAVVSKDVPDYAMMVGVPARQVGWMCECGQKLPEFKGETKCPKCGLGYSLSGKTLAATVQGSGKKVASK